MKIHHSEQLDETTYEVKLNNGLTVYLHPKLDYERTFAIFNTNFGSVDLNFIPLGEGEWVGAPQGVAHFLEHKLFEKEDGDVFGKFSAQGASANAFTSYEQTAYLFSAVNEVEKNLELLLDFVQDPYFTEETVEKEKGIIAQEILMYDDMPEWRIQRLLLENLYPKHPARYDIAGTVESIQEITSDILYENYHTFYHPENMQLFIIGPFDHEKILYLIEENQNKKEFAPQTPIQRKIEMAPLSEITPYYEEEADLSRSKAMLGIRGDEEKLSGKEKIKRQLAIRFGLDMLLGTTSDTYLTFYDQGIIDDSFNYSYYTGRTFNYISIEGDTKNPHEFLENIKNVLFKLDSNPDLNEEHLELIKQKSIGSTIHAFNSLEYIAQNFLTNKEEDFTIFDQVELMQQVELEDVKRELSHYLRQEAMSQVVLKSKAK